MSTSPTGITAERKGYSRGLILGLTMAETYILLVFCLLLVIGLAIAKQRRISEEAVRAGQETSQKLARAERERDDLLAEIQILRDAKKELERTIASLPKSAMRSTPLPKDWLELELVKQVVENLRAKGVSAEEVKQLAPTLQVLKEKGFLVSGETTVADRLEKVFNDAGKIGEHNWPPIINLSEAGGYFFAVGSAKLSPQFGQKLNGDIAQTIASYLTDYHADIVEVIGHTDEQPLAGASSNFDRTIGNVVTGAAPVTDIKPADNAGLGFARAVAVAQVLRKHPLLAHVTILPLSGAQLILPGDLLSDGHQAGDVEARRRIEIRVRRRSSETQDSAAGEKP